MNTASVTIRVDAKTKEVASSIAEDFGLDLSSITRAFYRQIVRERRIPLKLEYPRPNEESLEAIEETKKLIASKSTGYDSSQELFEALGI